MDNQKETFYGINFEINEEVVRVLIQETNIPIKELSHRRQKLLLEIQH